MDAISKDHEIDLVVLSHAPPTGTTAAPCATLRLLHLEIPPRSPTSVDRLRWLAEAHQPLEILGRDHTEIRRRLRAWLEEPYDLVWVTRAATFAALGPALPPAPTIVDIDDLEGDKLLARLASRSQRWTPRGQLHHLRDRRDAHAWSRLETRTAARVDAALVCSDLDRDRLGTDATRVLPNGYPRPSRPLGRRRARRPSTILIQGELTYEPNVEGAAWFVRHVLPHVHRARPDVRVRLVGRSDERVAKLHAPPRVTVTGFVDDIDAELARADVIAVPVRFGGGTRIKVLEAWAHGIPVVSTPAGAGGLNGRDGEHLLLAERPEHFAACCVRALTDDNLREQLVDTARGQFMDRYQHAVVVAEAAAIIDDVTGNRRNPTSRASGVGG